MSGLGPQGRPPPVASALAKDIPEEFPVSQNLRESHLRSILKAFSWRIIATLTTGLIAYFITGEVETAVMIGSIEFVLKFVIYYFHERIWQLAPRGSVRKLIRRKIERIATG